MSNRKGAIFGRAFSLICFIMANKKSTLPYIPIPYPLGNIKGPGQGSKVPMPQPQAGDVYNGYWDLFQQFGNYDQNFWETLFDLNETDARDFAFNQLGKQQDFLALLEQRGYDRSQLQDQRNYDFALLQNQRQYESPAAQLGRLMQTGLSRQAALQMIQNGVVQPTAGTPTQSQGIPGSSDGAGVSAASAANGQNTLNAMRNVVSMVLSLASFGVSAGAASATSSLQAAQSVAQQQANRAQQVSAALNAGLWRKQKGGADFKGKSFDDVAAMFADDEQLKPLLDEAMSTPGAYRIASDNYNTRFGNKNAMSVMRSMAAQARAAELQPDLIQQEILNSQAHFEEIFANIDLLQTQENIMEEKLPYEVSLLESQTESNSSQAELSRASTKQIDVERQISAHALRRLNLTAADMDATSLANAARELKYAQALGSDEYMNTALDNILKNEQMRNSLAVFNTLRLNNLNELVADNPELLNLHNLCNELNLGFLFKDFVASSHDLKNMPKDWADFIATFGVKNLMPGGAINPLQSIGIKF